MKANEKAELLNMKNPDGTIMTKAEKSRRCYQSLSRDCLKPTRDWLRKPYSNMTAPPFPTSRFITRWIPYNFMVPSELK